jgi:acyl-CoA synthetase (AMP-forming)/AMP-acid ligase II
MIAREVINFARQNPEQPALVSGSERWTYADLVRAGKIATSQLEDCATKQVGVWCSDLATILANLLALDSLGASAVLLPASATEAQILQRANELQLFLVVCDRSTNTSAATGDGQLFRSIDLSKKPPEGCEPGDGGKSQVVLFTSGTSGEPKPVIHTWKTLSIGLNFHTKFSGRRWLLAYEPTSFAGIQVWLQSLLTGGCICTAATRDPVAIARLLLDERVEFASATPSFWRLLLHSASSEELSKSALVQITLGGEAVDQPLLDALHRNFPQARLTHIYASTEMGVCFSVSDRQAGFPASYLSNPSLPCQLRIGDNGELEILSKRTMLGYLGDQKRDTETESTVTFDGGRWFATGDLVEQRGDRILFVGRKSETINVGGAKVYPADVERCIRNIAGVLQVRVYGMHSSLSGQLVAAEIQAAANVDQEDLRTAVIAACRQKLARHQVPARITFCEQLPLNASGKVVRKEVLNGA